MHHRWLCIAVALAATLSASACSLVGGEPPEAIVVGLDLPLTGASSELGRVHQRAAELRVTDINNRAGDTGRRIEIVTRDNGGDPVLGARNLADLARDPVIDVIVTAGCPSCVIDAAGALSVPVISLDPETGVSAEREWIFRVAPEAADTAAELARGIAEDGAKTVGIIATADAYGAGGIAAMEAAAERDDLAMVVRGRFGRGRERALGGAARTIAEWTQDPVAFVPVEEPGPDAVVVWAAAPGASEAAAALRAAGYDGPLYLDMPGADAYFLTPGSPLVGATVVHTSMATADRLLGTTPANAARIEFFRRYTAAYGGYDLRASWASDALTLVMTAAEAIPDGTRTASSLRDAIELARITGLGGALRFTPTDHSGLHPSGLSLFTAGERWV